MKSIVIFFCLITTFAYSNCVFAISDEKLTELCLEKGKTKIGLQAQGLGCDVDLTKIEVQEIDNRWYNPSKYVWYQVIGECNGYDRVIELVQYYNGKCI